MCVHVRYSTHSCGLMFGNSKHHGRLIFDIHDFVPELAEQTTLQRFSKKTAVMLATGQCSIDTSFDMTLSLIKKYRMLM
jgi:hypothetical protein